jgi:preprotein translocase subunit SecA
MDHLDAMESLREGIWLRGDKQASQAAYKKEAYQMFEKLIATIDANIARKIFRVHVSGSAPQPVSIPSNQMIARHDAVSVGTATATHTFSGNGQKQSKAKALPTSTKGSTSDLAAALSAVKEERKVDAPGIAQAKIGRNDLCPCGSGKKFKKCHGK